MTSASARLKLPQSELENLSFREETLSISTTPLHP